MSHPYATGIYAMANARILHEPLDELEHRIHGQKDVACPVDEAAERNPDEIRVVPSSLGCEFLDPTQNTRDHEAQEASPRRVGVGLTVRKTEDPERKKKAPPVSA